MGHYVPNLLSTAPRRPDWGTGLTVFAQCSPLTVWPGTCHGPLSLLPGAATRARLPPTTDSVPHAILRPHFPARSDVSLRPDRRVPLTVLTRRIPATTRPQLVRVPHPFGSAPPSIACRRFGSTLPLTS